MKLTFISVWVFLFIGLGFVNGAGAEDSQRAAIAMYPALAVKGSALNTKFVAEVTERKKSNPVFFEDPKWPMKLATECAMALAEAEDATKPKVAIEVINQGDMAFDFSVGSKPKINVKPNETIPVEVSVGRCGVMVGSWDEKGKLLPGTGALTAIFQVGGPETWIFTLKEIAGTGGVRGWALEQKPKK